MFVIFQGDVWAETSMLGFLWHYYACMEGKVYDITEWVACKVCNQVIRSEGPHVSPIIL